MLTLRSGVTLAMMHSSPEAKSACAPSGADDKLQVTSPPDESCYSPTRLEITSGLLAHSTLKRLAYFNVYTLKQISIYHAEYKTDENSGQLLPLVVSKCSGFIHRDAKLEESRR